MYVFVKYMIYIAASMLFNAICCSKEIIHQKICLMFLYEMSSYMT